MFKLVIMEQVYRNKSQRNKATGANNKALHITESKLNASPVKIRKIGNSNGILLSNKMLSHLGIKEGAAVTVTAEPGQLIIKPAITTPAINTDLSTWEAQFKQAIKNGDTPERDMFEGMSNKFDET